MVSSFDDSGSTEKEVLLRYGLLSFVSELIRSAGRSPREVQEIDCYAHIEGDAVGDSGDKLYVGLDHSRTPNQGYDTITRRRSLVYDGLLVRVCFTANIKWHGHGSVPNGHLRESERVEPQDDDRGDSEDHRPLP